MKEKFDQKDRYDGMSEQEWKEAIRFDSTDWGWIIMNIGMAIGAGVVFLPVQVGIVGTWVFLLSALLGYPALYVFQRLYINTLAASPKCEDYPTVISDYLGKNWGVFIGIIYFLMILISVFCYATAITNDSASFLYTFHLTDTVLSDNPWYGLVIICLLVAVASQGEKFLFRISSGLVLIKLLVIAALGIVMMSRWDMANIPSLPELGKGIYDMITLLPLTVTSILFIQTLSPMVISYRAHNRSPKVAWHKSLRAMNIAFVVLFVVIFFFAISFNLAMSHDQAVLAAEQNISAMAIAAQEMDGDMIKILGLILNIFAIMTAFFSVFLGFRESCQGIAMNLLRRIVPEEKISRPWVQRGTLVFAVLISWLAIALNLPVLRLLNYMGPLMAIIGCFIPAYLAYRVSFLKPYRTPTLWVIVVTGILLTISPLL